MSKIDDDLLAPEVIRDPYPYFAQLREAAPVCWNERYRAWIVTRYADVVRGLRDPALSSDRIAQVAGSAELKPATRAAMQTLSRWLVFKDPPDHTRLRRLVNKSFTSRAVANIQQRIDRIVSDLLDRCAQREEFDVVDDIAFPLPAIVIAELLGAPAEDRDAFRTWSDQISPIVFGVSDFAARRDVAADAVNALADYFSALVRRYEREPAENLVSSLVQARDSQDALTHDEVIATCMLLLFAGHETTTNLMANGIYHLLRDRSQAAMLAEDPRLAATAVEEILRYDGPSKITARFASAPTSLGGVPIAAGDRVFLVQASANRDPSVFASPDTLDIRRDPNPHVGFGFGIHFCLGAPLARGEACTLFASIFRRFPDLELTSDRVEWEPVLLSRGALSVRVRH